MFSQRRGEMRPSPNKCGETIKKKIKLPVHYTPQAILIHGTSCTTTGKALITLSMEFAHSCYPLLLLV